MRLNINLASRKYEDVRQFFLRWGIALAVLSGLAVLLATLTTFSYVRSAKSGRQIKELQQKVAALQSQRDQLAARENSPENREVTAQKKFWNDQIAKRDLSWTQLLNDLQKIMPARAFLNSVQPELTKDNRIRLKLVIAAEKPDDARELQKRMEDSNRFRTPRIESEAFQKSERNGPSLWKFEIVTDYTPASATPQPASPTPRGQTPAAASESESFGKKEAS